MMLHGRIPGKRMRPCAGGHKRVSEPSCYQKMGNPFSMPQVLHICRHLFHGFNRVFHFAVKTRRLRFFRNQQQCAIQMEAQSKGFRSLLSRQHCQLLLVPRHKRTRQIAILTSIGERHRARNRVNFRNRKALYSSQTYSCHGSPASVVTACTSGECSIRHLKNASNAALSWMLPGVTSASIRVCRKWYAPRTTFRRRCPAPDVLTTTRRWKTSWVP